VVETGGGALGRRPERPPRCRVTEHRRRGTAFQLLLSCGKPGGDGVSIDTSGGERAEQVCQHLVGTAGGGVELERREGHRPACPAQAKEPVTSDQVVDGLTGGDAEEPHHAPEVEELPQVVPPRRRAVDEEGGAPAELGCLVLAGTGEVQVVDVAPPTMLVKALERLSGTAWAVAKLKRGLSELTACIEAGNIARAPLWGGAGVAIVQDAPAQGEGAFTQTPPT
jgi:hypothetical protein